jgi:Cu/Ag efflux protein CusF
MCNWRYQWLGAVLVASTLSAGAGLVRSDEQPGFKTLARAKIVAIDPENNQLTIRTQEDERLAVVIGNETKIRLNDRKIRFSELREGSEVAVVYEGRNGRNLASTLTVVSAPQQAAPGQTPRPAEQAPLPEKPGTAVVIRAPKQQKVSGQVVKVMQASNSFILRFPDGHEDTFYFDNTASATDFQEGTDVTVVYQVRNVVNSIALGGQGITAPAPPRATEVAPATEGAVGGATAATGFETFNGDIVRVAPEEGLVVLRGRDGKERRFFTQKDTAFMLNNKKAKLGDFQTGSPVSLNFKSVDGRDMIHTLSSSPAAVKPRR